MKKIVLTLVLIVLIVFIFGLKNYNVKSDIKFILKGKKIICTDINVKYKDEGYKAMDSKYGDITHLVKVTDNVNYNKAGTYEINYVVENKDGVRAYGKRFIKVKEKPNYKSEYDNIDNTIRSWWSTNKKDGTRPLGGANTDELKKYNAYYMGHDEKVIYLTFDEGSLETYVKEIVDILDKNGVKGTFFLCHTFMVKNADLIRKMVNNGHSIGNHTVNHKSMPSLATREGFEEYLSEIKKMEDSYMEITGKKMDKIYRPPKGEWSYRDLKMVSDLGYKTYFYSSYYMDFADDVSKEYALNELVKRHHNGAIYLLHPKNKGNYLVLDSFINEMKRMGYRFDLVKNIP